MVVSTLWKDLPVSWTLKKKKEEEVGIKEALQRLQNLEKWVMPLMETYYLLISDLSHILLKCPVLRQGTYILKSKVML